MLYVQFTVLIVGHTNELSYITAYAGKNLSAIFKIYFPPILLTWTYAIQIYKRTFYIKSARDIIIVFCLRTQKIILIRMAYKGIF